jgi:hypothetical protein
VTSLAVRGAHVRSRGPEHAGHRRVTAYRAVERRTRRRGGSEAAWPELGPEVGPAGGAPSPSAKCHTRPCVMLTSDRSTRTVLQASQKSLRDRVDAVADCVSLQIDYGRKTSEAAPDKRTRRSEGQKVLVQVFVTAPRARLSDRLSHRELFRDELLRHRLVCQPRWQLLQAA